MPRTARLIIMTLVLGTARLIIMTLVSGTDQLIMHFVRSGTLIYIYIYAPLLT